MQHRFPKRLHLPAPRYFLTISYTRSLPVSMRVIHYGLVIRMLSVQSCLRLLRLFELADEGSSSAILAYTF
jgi:hypothetical protein